MLKTRFYILKTWRISINTICQLIQSSEMFIYHIIIKEVIK